MHSYTARWPEKTDFDKLPHIASFRFNDALDVVAWAEQDRLLGRWKNWPEVWHLDDAGSFCCYFKGSTGGTVKGFAEDPWELHMSRAQGLREGGCPDRWLIVESRPAWLQDGPTVDEGDAVAFHELRRELSTLGILLVDDVIFDDDFHWWSLQELTTGSTSWPRLEDHILDCGTQLCEEYAPWPDGM